MGRKAWNDAMRSAAGVNALPAELKPQTNKRRSDRRKKQDRREKARKITTVGNKELLAAAWMDALEDIAPSGPAADDDDSYDELDDLGDEKKKKKKRKRTTTKKTKAAGVLPKRFKPRSLATILLEEMNREDGVALDWLNNEARDTSGKKPIVRKLCPVTGQFGIYTEPKSQIPYASLKALEQIRERPPPWLNLTGGMAYHEAVTSIRGEES